MIFVLFSYLPCELALIVLITGLLYRKKSRTLGALNVSMAFLSLTLGLYAFLINATGDQQLASAAELIYRVAFSAILSIFLAFFVVLSGKPVRVSLAVLLVLPPLIVAIFSLVLNLTLGSDIVSIYLDTVDRLGYDEALRYNQSSDFRTVFICAVVYSLIVIFQTLFLQISLLSFLRNNKFSFKQLFNAFKGIPISSSSVLALLMMLLTDILLVMSLVSRSVVLNHTFLFILAFLLLSFIIIVMGNIAIVYPHSKISLYASRADAQLKPFDTDLYPNMHTSPGQEPEHSALYLRFYSYLIEEKAFLDPDLTVEKVCVELSTNRTYVSNLLATEFGMSFRDLVNKCRIEYSKRLMKEQPTISFDEVATKSGFKSSSQFSKKFKEHDGIAPSRWKSIHLN